MEGLNANSKFQSPKFRVKSQKF